MTHDPTEYQTVGGQSTSKKLSMKATTPPADVPGYRLTEFLGAGAFGQVWVGRDLNTGRDVAVKFYLHRGGVNWSLLSREVKNLVQMSADRYVVQVLEVGWDADPPYYVMELVKGGSLEDLLTKSGRMPVADAVEMFRKICIGLNRCHGRGVLHCDLKPANILLGEEHEPRLADFGQSRLSNDQTPALGTLFYMAPEQADLTSTPDASWDVYAVGAIMYRLLTGQAPYRDGKIVEQLDTAGSLVKRLERYRESIVASPAPEGHSQSKEVDRALSKIVSKCLAADPSNRYANVQQILQDLNRRDVTRARRPLLLLGIVGPLLVLLVTSFFSVRSISRARQSALHALKTEANGSNRLAASFAARTLEGEIERYFHVAEGEASRPEFLSQLTTVLQDAAVTKELSEIASLRTPAATQGSTEARERLLDLPSRLKLDQVLQRQLNQYASPEPRNHRPRLATMFVTDAAGTILGVAYTQQVGRDANSAGKNFCYRTYYHGGRVDLPKDSTVIGEVGPLTSTHLSAAFPSTATHLWKVAISTPIYLSEDRSHPDAMFVTTVNLGDFELLQSKQGSNQIAVLVEAREGPAKGTILQHPLMDARRTAGIKVEDEKYQISKPLMDRLLAGDEFDYRDPLAKAEDGGVYAGPWIAAMQPVSVPHTHIEHDFLAPASVGQKADSVSDEPTSTDVTDEHDEEDAPKGKTADLLVLVQYRLEKVIAPVHQMESALWREGVNTVGSILALTVILWFFVRRAGSSRRRTTVDQQQDTLSPTETMKLQ